MESVGSDASLKPSEAAAGSITTGHASPTHDGKYQGNSPASTTTTIPSTTSSTWFTIEAAAQNAAGAERLITTSSHVPPATLSFDEAPATIARPNEPESDGPSAHSTSTASTQIEGWLGLDFRPLLVFNDKAESWNLDRANLQGAGYRNKELLEAPGRGCAHPYVLLDLLDQGGLAVAC